MTIIVRLGPQREAKLLAVAESKGMTAGELVTEAIDKILDAVLDQRPVPKQSLYGLLAKYGPGPSEEEIDENRREMFLAFGEYHP